MLGRAFRSVRTRSEAAFLGWFGPTGIASIYFALLVAERSDAAQVWPLAARAGRGHS
jgi:sodium/hydrogen antiporter